MAADWLKALAHWSVHTIYISYPHTPCPMYVTYVYVTYVYVTYVCVCVAYVYVTLVLHMCYTCAWCCYPEGCAAPGQVLCQCNTRGSLSKLKRTPPQTKINVTSKSPVGDISVVTLIRTDTTLDHSQKAEKVCKRLLAKALHFEPIYQHGVFWVEPIKTPCW